MNRCVAVEKRCRSMEIIVQMDVIMLLPWKRMIKLTWQFPVVVSVHITNLSKKGGTKGNADVKL
tara:strand:+ start:405 stop:596 length:192 start_codon:yes stop_codon:yes gene_type:complete